MKIKIKFNYSESGFCYDVYKVLEINGEPCKSETNVCRMEEIKGVGHWHTFTGEEPDSPLKKGIIIEIVNHDGSILVDTVANDGCRGAGTVVFPFSWDNNIPAKQ